jgi:hypothetical protein
MTAVNPHRFPVYLIPADVKSAPIESYAAHFTPPPPTNAPAYFYQLTAEETLSKDRRVLLVPKHAGGAAPTGYLLNSDARKELGFKTSTKSLAVNAKKFAAWDIFVQSTQGGKFVVAPSTK